MEKRISTFLIALLLSVTAVVAQTPITGTVVSDDDGQPLVGATITVQETKKKTLTNDKGKFTIQVPPGTKLSVSYIGFKTQVVSMKNGITVRLKTDIQSLNDVVVTGIFNKPKESFTGAAVKVTQKQLKTAGNRNILQSLSNIDPSFQIVHNNTTGYNPNKLPEIRMRGVSTIPQVSDLQSNLRAELNTPLFILDGFEITLERVMDLNNDEIESVTLLKDASATAIYGSRGANGVVVITTVKPEKGKHKSKL